MSSVSVRCRCGQVRGRVEDASPETVNRIVCMCADCQAFVHHLGRADLLDAHGGTDIVQVAPGRLYFDQGSERIVGLRLTPKGLYRFYADCCKTPLGNTVGPAIPFVGVVAQAFERPDETFGPPIAKIQGKSAIGTPPPGSEKLSLRMLGRVLRLVLGWRLRGKAWPHPFFDRGAKTPTRPMTTLSTSEREALRPLCGPKRAPPDAHVIQPHQRRGVRERPDPAGRSRSQRRGLEPCQRKPR